MSRNSPKKTDPRTLSEQKTLPIQSPDAKTQQTNAARQNRRNVSRAKKWQEEHGS